MLLLAGYNDDPLAPYCMDDDEGGGLDGSSSNDGLLGVPDTYAANSGAGSRALPAAAVVLLRTWMLSHEHFAHPYPTDAEKEELAAACGISVRQASEAVDGFSSVLEVCRLK